MLTIQSQKPQGTIYPLKNYRCEERILPSEEKFEFVICPQDGRIFVFSATSLEERTSWVTALSAWATRGRQITTADYNFLISKVETSKPNEEQPKEKHYSPIVSLQNSGDFSSRKSQFPDWDLKSEESKLNLKLDQYIEDLTVQEILDESQYGVEEKIEALFFNRVTCCCEFV